MLRKSVPSSLRHCLCPEGAKPREVLACPRSSPVHPASRRAKRPRRRGIDRATDTRTRTPMAMIPPLLLLILLYCTTPLPKSDRKGRDRERVPYESRPPLRQHLPRKTPEKTVECRLCFSRAAAQVRGRGSDRKFQATRLAVGEECDLAILTVEDDEFWQGTSPLDFGELPELTDQVSVIG